MQMRDSSPVKREASSVNHGFTLVWGRAPETQRLSHTGNVFEQGAFPGSSRADRGTLDELRLSVISDHIAAVK